MAVFVRHSSFYFFCVPQDVHNETVVRLIDLLIAERKRRDISQQVLADMAGLSRTGIRHMESGNINPTLYTFLKVAAALEINLAELLLKSQKAPGRRKQ